MHMEGLPVEASDRTLSGRIQKAPENFLDQEGIRTVIAESKSGRRNFIRQAFAAAATACAHSLSDATCTLAITDSSLGSVTGIVDAPSIHLPSI